MNKEERFRSIFTELKEDPQIISVFLGGSRGKSQEFIKKASDYDVFIITKDGAATKYRKHYNKLENEDFDFIVMSLSEFKKEPEEWNRYNYAYITPLFDKSNMVKRLIDEKAKIPIKIIKKYVSGHLDGYINYVYRSFKCWRDDNVLGARLEANKSVDIFLNITFALHGGRAVPYYKYLEWDLRNHPLTKLGLSNAHLVSTIRKIINRADINAQKELFKSLEKLARREGYGKSFDSWGHKIEFIRNFK